VSHTARWAPLIADGANAAYSESAPSAKARARRRGIGTAYRGFAAAGIAQAAVWRRIATGESKVLRPPLPRWY